MKDLYIARQPIFDTSLKPYGYELLYRADNTVQADIQDPNQATAHTVTLGLIEIGLDRLVGDHKAFINLSPDYVMGSYDLPFPEDKVVLEIPDSYINESNSDHTLDYLSKRNYSIALDGVTTESHMLKLLPIADIVKIDISKSNPYELEKLIKLVKTYPVKVIADKVEDGTQLNKLIDLGFDFLQGYFFCKPTITKESSLSSNQLAMMNLLAKVYSPAIGTEELEDAVSQDVTLSYHLLKYLNSAFFSLKNKLESIKQAVIYLGRNELKTWATVVSMAGHNDKPDELITTALVRAKFCESTAKSLEKDNTDSFFSAGLLSVLDALMDQPMNRITSQLPLNNELNNALNEHTGIIGETLGAALMLEKGEWDSNKFQHLSMMALNIQYQNSIIWADDVVKNMSIN